MIAISLPIFVAAFINFRVWAESAVSPYLYGFRGRLNRRRNREQFLNGLSLFYKSGLLLCFFLCNFCNFSHFWRFRVEKTCFFSVSEMRGFGFLCLLLLIGTAAFVYHGFSCGGILSSNPGMVSRGSNAMALVLKSRKLKENRDPPTPDKDEDRFSLEDYQPIDPVPNSKASIRHGPIQHGTPLMPFIPPAPGKPQHGG